MPLDRHSELIRPRRVSVDELRQAVDRSALSHVEIARRMGWMRSDKPTPDGRRVARTLGLRAQDNSHGYGSSQRQFVNWATAERLLAALEEMRDAA